MARVQERLRDTAAERETMSLTDEEICKVCGYPNKQAFEEVNE